MTRREVRAALRELPDAQSRVTELAYHGGFTHTEIADRPAAALVIALVLGSLRGVEKVLATAEPPGGSPNGRPSGEPLLVVSAAA